jgi:hypothetical protein
MQRVWAALQPTQKVVDQSTHLEAGQQKVLRFFERGDRRFARDAGKTLQELFERLAAFRVVK